MYLKFSVNLVVLVSIVICTVEAQSQDGIPDSDFGQPETDPSDYIKPSSDLSSELGSIEEIPSGEGQIENLGLGRFQYSDILLMSWVPHPVDEWEYVLINSKTDHRFVQETGRGNLNLFNRQNFPDVAIIFTCNEGDVNYFYNDQLVVPVIGVDAFKNDYPFQEYLDNVYSTHGFTNRPNMWSHFFLYPKAFDHITSRIADQYRDYLEDWRPKQYQLSSQENSVDSGDNNDSGYHSYEDDKSE